MISRPRLGQALSQINHPRGEFQKALFKIVVPLNFLSLMPCPNLKRNLDVGWSMLDVRLCEDFMRSLLWFQLALKSLGNKFSWGAVEANLIASTDARA